MTFHAYQRMLRINTAYGSIRKGHSVTLHTPGTEFQQLVWVLRFVLLSCRQWEW